MAAIRRTGRPRANVDFVTVCDTLRDQLGEPGAIARTARQFGIRRAWIYKHVIPVLMAGTDAADGE